MFIFPSGPANRIAHIYTCMHAPLCSSDCDIMMRLIAMAYRNNPRPFGEHSFVVCRYDVAMQRGSSIYTLDRWSLLPPLIPSQYIYDMLRYPLIAFADCDLPTRFGPVIGQIWWLLCITPLTADKPVFHCCLCFSPPDSVFWCFKGFFPCVCFYILMIFEDFRE